MPQITGDPTTAGTYTPTIEVTDATGATATVQYSITVNAGSLALAVTTTSLNAGATLSSYSFQLAAHGGSGIYTWTLVSGSLTGSGISLSTGGLLTGATPVAGTYANLVFQVTDTESNTAQSVPLTLTVTTGTLALSVTTTALGTVTAGVPYSMQLTAQGGTVPYTWTLNSGSLTGSGITLSSGGLLSGTSPVAGIYGPLVFKVTDNVSATALSPSLTLTVSTPAPTMFPLPVVVELFINGTWTDVTQFVYQRDGIQITGGKTDRSGQANPATATLTFNNRDGRFSPNFAAGVYWPHIGRNTQIRISLAGATSSSGNIYNGYRFWGEVPEWPPLSDVSGRDVYVSITASGPLRRIRQGGGEGSALDRYYASLTGVLAPVAYWPVEEDPDATAVGSGVQDGVNMSVTGGPPLYKAVSNFNGSAPICVLNGATLDGFTGGIGGPAGGNDVFETPGTFQWTASTTTVTANVFGGGGGGANGGWSGGGSGGGVRTAVVNVTPGTSYNLTVGAGGRGGPGGNSPLNEAGGIGGNSSFTGDSNVTVTAFGGRPGLNSATAAPGVTGSGAGTSFTSGSGGTGVNNATTGAGGGSSGGLTALGNAGQVANTHPYGAGGAPPAGAGRGGNGGQGENGLASTRGQVPGGGGGGGGNNGEGYNREGAAGASGMVQLLYNTPAQPPANIIRFILYVPQHGGNNGKVLIRAWTGGTIAKLDCQYRTGGNIRLFGYNSGGSQIVDSGNLSVSADGRALMVSMELKQSGFPLGTSVAWQLSAIAPGAPGVGNQTVSGILAASVLGNVTEVLAGPNGDITKTAIGHISVQYGWVALWEVSQALDGNQYEATVDRFLRLAGEEAMDNSLVNYSETTDHWGFEDGTLQSWAPVNGSLSNTTASFTTPAGRIVWPPEGIRSLLLTANGSGQPSATSVTGASGAWVQPGDVASVSIDLYAPVQLNNAYVGLKWYDAAGTFISESDCPDTVLPAATPVTLRLIGKLAMAPSVAAGAAANAQYAAVTFGDHNTDTTGTLLYADNARFSAHMGVQTRKQYQEFLEEIQELEGQIMAEGKEFFGLKLSTRIEVINQDPAVQLDYSQQMLSPPLAPVVDTRHVRNNIIVHRHKGSSVEVSLGEGPMSIQEPPNGVGRFKKTLKLVAAVDEQLAAYAAELLTIGTDPSERYPTITVDLTRASLPGNPLAPLMSAVAGVEVGEMVELDFLPFWYPAQTAQQMVIGYTEVINSYGWTITWNCLSYAPYVKVITSLRRW